jgi:hypothetical protein
MQGKFTRVVPMTSRKDAGKSLVDFTDDVGIPERLIMDGSTAEFTGRHTEFVKEARRMRIMLHTTEQGRSKESEPCGGTRNWLPSEMMEANDEETSTQMSMGLRTRLRERVVMPYYGTRE